MGPVDAVGRGVWAGGGDPEEMNGKMSAIILISSENSSRRTDQLTCVGREWFQERARRRCLLPNWPTHNRRGGKQEKRQVAEWIA